MKRFQINDHVVIKKEDLLTRDQLKAILGGESGSGGCSVGACTVYVQNTGQTYAGSCSTYVHPGGPHGSTSSHCICWTTLGHYDSTNNYAACTP